MGDLRYCVANAQTGDTIDFKAALNGQTILLNNRILLAKGVTIIGQDLTNPNKPVPVNITISGQNKTRICEVSSSEMVTLTNLIFTAGNGTNSTGAAGNGGALLVDSGASVTLNSDIFNNNNTTGQGTNGGAIENDGFTQVNGCTFSANNSVNNGGAIENTDKLSIYYEGSTVSSFSVNTAANGNGGAIDSSGNGSGSLNVGGGTTFDKNSAKMGGAISTSDSFSVRNDFFGTSTANVATVAGGAIYAQGSGAGDVTDCTFANNEAGVGTGGGLGGAIYTSTMLDVERSKFTLNTASLYGGALAVSYQDHQNDPPLGNQQNLTLNLDTFDQNSAQTGGGVFLLNNASIKGKYRVDVTNDTFSNNKAQGNGSGIGGGLYLEEDTAGVGTLVQAFLSNLTFFNNTADTHGGGLYLYITDSTGSNMEASAVLTSLTVNQNTAGTDSGGMYVNSALQEVVQVNNSIFDGNTVTANGYNGPVDVTMTNANKALKDNGYNLTGLSDTMFALNLNNGNIANNNPGLAAALAANGAPAGFPLTLALQKTSPGYEKGDQNLVGTGVTGDDERGFSRQAGKVSIGAEDPDAQAPQQEGAAMSLNSSTNPAVPNQAVTFTVNVTGQNGTPTGTVTFMADDTVLDTVDLDSNGNATLTTSELPLGSDTITALYSGDDNYDSNAAFLTQTVNYAASSVSLTSNANPSPSGQAVTFTATVSGSSGTPSGSVTFMDGTTILATVALDSNGVATYTTSSLADGSHDITTIYSGDSTYASSAASLTQNVGSSFTVSGATIDFTGVSISDTFSASISGTISGRGLFTFTGAITVGDSIGVWNAGDSVFGSGQLTFSGNSWTNITVFSLNDDATGASVLAFPGIANGTISGTTLSGNIGTPTNPATMFGFGVIGTLSGTAIGGGLFTLTPSISLTSDTNPSLPGQAVTLTATVQGSSGTPTGSVLFLDGTTVLGMALLDANGIATFTTSALPLGSQAITAIYSGDSTYAGSTATLTQQVVQAASATSLSSSANPSPQGQEVTFTVTVAAVDPNVGTPTGTVYFYDGTTPLGSGTLSVVNGQVQATFTTAALALGKHQIIAIYSGDGTFADSGASLEQTIS